MRALAIVHKAAPLHNAGAEWMLHAILRDWRARGDDVYVVFPGAPSYTLDGVIVGPTPTRGLERLCREVDVVVTHLDNTGAATRAARIAGRPVVHLLHNDRQLQYHNVKPAADTLLVANSAWIRDTVPKGFHRVVTCRPHVTVADYALEHPAGELVTLVNRTDAKGAGVLYAIAEAMPARRFLAVAGAYGVQSSPPKRLRNVELAPQTANIRRDVYARTRVLLMPSSYESWGRVAIEAACSGIPCIAHPTPGLRESLGPAGIFADRGRVREWTALLRDLEAPDVYAEASARARARALELEAATTAELAELYAAVTDLAGGRPYDSSVAPILDSMQAAAKCPVCGAARCSCSAEDVRARAGSVRFVDPIRPGGPPKRYRTWRGDFRHSEAGAIRAGLIPDPDSPAVPDAVRRRFRGAGADLADLERAYAAARLEARTAFLAAVAVTTPMALRARYAELVAELASSPGPARSSTEPTAELGPGDPPVGGRVGDVLEWCGTDRARIEAALEAERAGKARSTLLAELERRKDA